MNPMSKIRVIANQPLIERTPQIWEAILAIQKDVENARNRGKLDPSLSGGLGGAILLNRYLYTVTGEIRFESEAEKCLDELLNVVNRLPLTAFYTGTLGVAWLLVHLARLDGEEPDVSELDEILVAVLEQPWTGVYDLIGGLVGVGLYGFERLPHEMGELFVARVVQHLDTLSSELSGTVVWHTPPHHIAHNQMKAYPEGYYNLGLAHGMSGCIRILAEAYQYGIEKELTRRLLESAVPGLLRQLRVVDGSWCLPALIEDQIPARPRLAWCYNELGAMTAVLAAAHALGRDDWQDRAVEVATSTCGLPLEHSGCKDAGLCHGAAGVAHIYQVLGEYTGQHNLADEARRWLSITLDMRKPNQGCGGYSHYAVDDETGQPRWENSSGFLEGGTGIALALLSASHDVTPSWNRIMGLS